MKKRLLSLLLALVMLVGIIPATSLTAHAAGTHSILVDGVDMSDGTYLAVGASNTTTSKPSGGYAYWKDDVLTLNNFEIDEGEISCETSFKLYLYGTNTITRTSAESGNKDAISCSEGSLTIDGNGILNIKNDWACIYAYENLIINGGILNLKSTFETVRDKDNRVYFARGTSWYAIEVEGAFSINGGYVYAEAGLSALRAEAYHFNGGACHFNCISEGISGSNGDLENSAICPCDDSYSIGNPLTLVKESCRSFEEVSFDKICDYMAYSNFPKYTELVIISEIEFANQFPEIPAGKTEHNLGKVSSEYVMTFGAIDTFLPLVNKGYKIIEKLIVYDRDNNKIVDTVTNNPQLSGTGISYSLKNLPSGNYIIRESIILYDKDGKALYGNNNDFILEVERTVNNINVSATFSGTPADATTSTTGAAVTATKWYKKNGSGWTELGASDTIKEGNTYRCEVTVGTTGDYVFTDGYTVKINGIAATKKSGNTWYRDVTITGYTSYVDVYDIALPEAGAHPDFTFNDEDCSHSSVALVEWFECDKDGKKLSGALSADYKFKEDSYYRLEVTAVPDANYEFDTRNLGFYIGPKAVQYYYPYQDTTYPDSVTGWKVYHVDDANGTYTVQIGDIPLKDGNYLANNATAVTTVKPVGGYAYYKDGVLTLNNFVAAKLVRYYERYLEVELIGENKIGAIADYYYWDTTSNDYFTGLEFRGTGNLEFDVYYGHPYCNVSVNGDVIFNGSGDILLDAEFYCFQYTDNVIINDGYVYCYTSMDSVFGDDTIIEVNGGKLQMFDAGCWDKFLCNGTLTIAAGSVYINDDPRKIELEDCVPWDGVTDLNTYDNVLIVYERAVSNITVNCIGDIDYTVSGNVVIVTHDKPCKLGYANADGKYVTLTAIKNSDGSYAFTVPADVTEVILAVKGDISGDGRINVGDVSKLYAHVKQTSPLSGDTLFIADISGDNRINVGDVSKLYASVKQTAPLTWDI